MLNAIRVDIEKKDFESILNGEDWRQLIPKNYLDDEGVEWFDIREKDNVVNESSNVVFFTGRSMFLKK